MLRTYTPGLLCVFLCICESTALCCSFLVQNVIYVRGTHAHPKSMNPSSVYPRTSPSTDRTRADLQRRKELETRSLLYRCAVEEPGCFLGCFAMLVLVAVVWYIDVHYAT